MSLSVKDLVVEIDGRHVVDGISFEVPDGARLGLIGESGSGKSLTALAVLGLLPDGATTSGSIRWNGTELVGMPDRELARLRGDDIGIVFQEPRTALNPIRTVGRQIAESIRIHEGLGRREARERAIAEAARVRLPDPASIVDRYPHQLSGGQRQRVAIAMALACRPRLLIADEPTTALDVTIQAQILELLRRIQRETGMAIVLISHDLGVVSDICERIAVMYAGRIVEMADTESIFSRPSHPYTRGLLAAFPDVERPKRKLSTIPGAVPGPGEIRQGCPFLPRCADKVSECGQVVPAFASIAPRHFAACHRTGQGAGL